MEALPVLINSEVKIQENFPLVDEKETNYIREAQGLFAAEFYSYSLLAVWNAAINNLKRKYKQANKDQKKAKFEKVLLKDEKDILVDEIRKLQVSLSNANS